MDVDALMLYVRSHFVCPVPIDGPPPIADPPLPLMLSYEQLNEIIDGTELTVEEWLRVAYHGIVLFPDEVQWPVDSDGLSRDDGHGHTEWQASDPDLR